jgi:hypothetical protein
MEEKAALCGHVHGRWKWSDLSWRWTLAKLELRTPSVHHTRTHIVYTREFLCCIFCLLDSIYLPLFTKLKEAADELFSCCTWISIHRVASRPSPWATTHQPPWVQYSRSWRKLGPGLRELETRWGPWAPTLGLGIHEPLLWTRDQIGLSNDISCSNRHYVEIDFWDAWHLFVRTVGAGAARTVACTGPSWSAALTNATIGAPLQMVDL